MCVSCTQHTKLLMAPGMSKTYSNANNYFKKMLDTQQVNYHCLWLPTFCTDPHRLPALCTLSIPFPHQTVSFHLFLLAFAITPYSPFANPSLSLFSPCFLHRIYHVHSSNLAFISTFSFAFSICTNAPAHTHREASQSQQRPELAAVSK